MGNKRIITLMALLAFTYAILVGRVFYIQVISGKAYASLVEKQAVRRKILPPRRGEIWDRHGKRMSINADIDVRVQQGKTSKMREIQRVAPYGHVAGQVIGNVGHDGYGQVGLEYSLDQVLRGEDGYEYIRMTVDKKYHPNFKGQRRDPVDGNNVILSIDVELQKIAEQALERGVKRVKAKRGCAVVIDPKNGDVLAIANYPFYDPNRRSETDMESWKNFAVSSLYEPGSTFKSITSSAVLQEKVTTPDERFFAENGVWRHGVALIKDSKPMGEINFTEAFAHSSNIVMVKASSRLKPDVFYQYIRSFGFGIKTGIKLPAEEGGSLRPPRLWNARSQATLAWGQEISATALQVAMAGATIANGGTLYRPRLILGTRNVNGQMVEKYPPQAVRRAISVETAKQVRGLMKAVVEAGTAAGIKSAQFSLGGKTGTAEKINPETGMYMPGHFNSSFLGMVPVEDPSLVALVVIDEPELEKHGGRSAAPIFKEIIERTASLGGTYTSLIRKDFADTLLVVPPAPVALASVRMPSLSAEESNGDSIQSVDSGLRETSGPIVWRMPNLTNLSLRDAMQKLGGMPLRVQYNGRGKVVSQDPPYNAVISPGQKCIITLNWEHN